MVAALLAPPEPQLQGGLGPGGSQGVLAEGVAVPLCKGGAVRRSCPHLFGRVTSTVWCQGLVQGMDRAIQCSGEVWAQETCGEVRAPNTPMFFSVGARDTLGRGGFSDEPQKPAPMDS